MGIISLTVTCGLLVASHWRREATKYARWIAFTGSKWTTRRSACHRPSRRICGDLTFKNVAAKVRNQLDFRRRTTDVGVVRTALDVRPGDLPRLLEIISVSGVSASTVMHHNVFLRS